LKTTDNAAYKEWLNQRGYFLSPKRPNQEKAKGKGKGNYSAPLMIDWNFSDIDWNFSDSVPL